MTRGAKNTGWVHYGYQRQRILSLRIEILALQAKSPPPREAIRTRQQILAELEAQQDLEERRPTRSFDE